MRDRSRTRARAAKIWIALVCGICTSAIAGTRDWTTADSIAVRYLIEGISESSALNPSEMAGPADGSGAFQWSPGNRYFFYITRYGDLGCDCNRYTLTLYDARKLSSVLRSPVLRAKWTPTPLKELTFETTASNEFMVGISEPRWIDDETLLFVGVREGHRQLFRLSASSGSLEQLTHVSTSDDPEKPSGDDSSGSAAGISYFQLLGDTLIYNTVEYVRYPPLVARYPAVSLAESRLSRLHFFGRYSSDIYVSRPAGSAPRHVARCNQSGTLKFFSVSPDGRKVVTTCLYTDVLSPEGRDSQVREVVQYLLVDAQDGSTKEIARALSRGAEPRAVWSDDSTRVTLLNAFVSAGNRCGSESSLQVVSYVIDTNEATCVAPMSRDALNAKTGTLKSVRAPAARPVRVEALRSANDPWRVVAGWGARTIPLSVPDPALADVQIVPTTPFVWKVGTEEDVGGLYVPAHRASGIRVPLVIQVGHYVPYRFLPDGSASTAYAAQALAAQGMAVLNISVAPEQFLKQGLSVEAAMTKRIDAVVEALDHAGIIDPLKVGLIGFSHSGFQVHYLATHPGAVKLAAGVVADSFTGSYGQYTFLDSAMMDSRASQSQMERFMGGSKFWDDKETWLRQAPTFNVDRVTAPMLFALHGARYSFFAGEILGAYRIAGKPFEYLLFPKGAHQLQTPLERKASMDASVSWMAFWLQGREIAGMQTPETYARWQRMKGVSARLTTAK